jgi:hypothetical protein
MNKRVVVHLGNVAHRVGGDGGVSAERVARAVGVQPRHLRLGRAPAACSAHHAVVDESEQLACQPEPRVQLGDGDERALAVERAAQEDEIAVLGELGVEALPLAFAQTALAHDEARECVPADAAEPQPRLPNTLASMCAVLIGRAVDPENEADAVERGVARRAQVGACGRPCGRAGGVGKGRRAALPHQAVRLIKRKIVHARARLGVGVAVARHDMRRGEVLQVVWQQRRRWRRRQLGCRHAHAPRQGRPRHPLRNPPCEPGFGHQTLASPRLRLADPWGAARSLRGGR